MDGTNIAVSITGIDAVLTTPIAAFLTLTTSSMGAATNTAGTDSQVFMGTFCITSAAGCTGTNYLSSVGTFTDTTSGLDGGTSLVMSVAQPPATVMFSSDVITALGLGRSMSLSFTNLSPALAIYNGSLGVAGDTTAAISGDFSANVGQTTPEPATLGLLGIALAGLGFARRRTRG